jgi:hypothetical protein
MARTQAPAVAGFDQLQPPIRRAFLPTDTLVTTPQVASPASNDFLQFADALSKVNPEINKFLQGQAKEYTAAEEETARSQAIKSGLTYQEAVKRNLITPDQSPWFMRAWREVDGANAGDVWSANVKQAAAESGILNSGDPAKLHQWITDQVGTASQGMDPDTQAGFMTKVLQTHKELQKQFSTTSATNAWAGMTTAASTQMANTLDAYIGEVKNTNSPVDATELAPRLHSVLALPKFVGLDNATADEMMRAAVAQKALQYKDKDLLNVLTMPRPDTRQPGAMIDGPGSTVKGQALIQQTKDQIDAKIASDNAQAHAAEEQARKEAVRKWEQAGVEEALRTGNISTETMLRANREGGADAATKLQGFLEGRRKVNDYAPPQALAAALMDLHTGNYQNGETPLSAALRMVNEKRIPSQDVDRFMEKANEVQQTGLYKNPDYKRMLGQISGEISDPMFGKLFDKPELRSQAANEFMTVANLKVKALGLNPDALAVQKALADTQQEIITRYQKLNSGTAKEPAPEKPKAEDTSSSGGPKLTMIPGQEVAKWRRALAAPGADVERIKQDLRNKYSPDALKRTLNIE